MRVINLLLAGCVITFAFVIYELKYETAELSERVAELRESIRGERDAVAVLRAEWSHLNRPDRVERLARKHLGLEPLKARQLLTISQYKALNRSNAAEMAARMLGQSLPARSRERAALN